MEIEKRMGMRVRPSYENVVAWIRGGGKPVSYPNRTALQLIDSHVYSQLNAMMSSEETQRVVNEYRRDWHFGPPGGGGNQPPAPPGGGNPPRVPRQFPGFRPGRRGGPGAPPGPAPGPGSAPGFSPGSAPSAPPPGAPGPSPPPAPSPSGDSMDVSSTTEDEGPAKDMAALLGGFGGGPPPAPGAGAAALARDPLIGPSGPPVMLHAGRLLQAGQRQFDQVIINAGFQPPRGPPGAGAVAIPAQQYMKDVSVPQSDVQTPGQIAAAAAGHVALGLVARALAQSTPQLASAPLYAGALDAMAAAGHVVRRHLGGSGGPDAGSGASSVQIPGGLSFAEVRQMFEHAAPTPIDRMFVERGAPRDGAAVMAMQRAHDLGGGSAPHLDIRSINGWNEGYGLADRRSKPARIEPFQFIKPRAKAILDAAKPVPKGLDIVVSSSSNGRGPPPPPPAKIRRDDQPVVFPTNTPYAQALQQFQKAPLAEDAALAAQSRSTRERSPLRGDRRPLSTRNKSREKREAAGGGDETYGQIRDKALSMRSKTVPAEIFIGEKPKRSRAVPPNQAALMQRAATRTVATKRNAPSAAEDERDRQRGGAANPERAARRQRLSRLYADRTNEIPKKSKTASPEVHAKKSKSSSLEVSARPEDKYGVRRRVQAQRKHQRASQSRDRALVV